MKWTIHPISEFPAHADAWAALNHAGAGTILQDPDYWRIQLQHWGDGTEQLAVLRASADPVGMTIVRPRRRGVWESFQPSQAPLGPRVGRWNDDDASGRSLVRAIGTFALAAGLTQQDPDHHPRPQDSRIARTRDYIETGRIRVPGSFDEYWSARGRNLRKNLRRQRNGLERDGVATRFESVSDPAAMEDAVRDYGDLESAGWKAERGTAIAADNAQGRFYRELLEHLAARGEARVWRYFFDERLVATDICLLRDGELIILKTTYDEALSQGSPAFLMREEAFREVMDTGEVKVIEFYGPVMEWHRKWSEEFRHLYHATWYRNSLVRRAYGVLAAARKS